MQLNGNDCCTCRYASILKKYPELHDHSQNEMSRIPLNKEYNAHSALIVLQELVLREKYISRGIPKTLCFCFRT